MKQLAQTIGAWRQKGGIRPWLYLPLAFISLALLDFVLRYVYRNHGAWRFLSPAPTIATISWCLLLVGIAALLPARGRKVYLGFAGIFFALLTVTHAVLQNLFRRFFMFSAVAFAADGAAFADTSYIRINPWVLCGVLVSFLLMTLALILAPCNGEVRTRGALMIALLIMLSGSGGVVLVHTLWLTPNQTLAWDNFNNPAAVYESFTDSTGALLVSGLYQYTVRDAALLCGVGKSLDEGERTALEQYATARRASNTDNEYTGLFEGENLILVQLEAIDTWMLAADYMPKLYKLKQESMVFAQHYTPAYITAGTLNTEFMANTGLFPATGSVPISVHERNSYPFSMANQFRAAGYSAESFHGSEGNVYNRATLHPALGYERYNSGNDMEMENYTLDRYLMAGYEDMTPESPFLSFVITYSGHGPYGHQNCIYLEHAKQAKKLARRSEENYIWAVGHAMETDQFIGELMERLEKDGLLENTVVAFYADHYNYYMMDDALSMEIKGSANLNMLQNTDFFIYAKGAPKQTITKVTSTPDILPTLSNLFKLEDGGAVYLGNDAFSEHGGNVFFSDRSDYDGTAYHDRESEPTRESYARAAEIDKAFRMSNLILRSDFFGS